MYPIKKDLRLYFVRLNTFERLHWSEFAERVTNSLYGDETMHEIITLTTQTTNYLGREKTDIMGVIYNMSLQDVRAAIDGRTLTAKQIVAFHTHEPTTANIVENVRVPDIATTGDEDVMSLEISQSC